MDDNEINRRVAEIEEWALGEDGRWRHPWLFGKHPQVNPPDYATDWAWVGPLAEKYKIGVMPQTEEWAAYGRVYRATVSDGTSQKPHNALSASP